MAATDVIFSAWNNADWVHAFALVRASAGTLPWVNVAQWSGDGEYQASLPASVVVHEDNLYLAKGPTDPTMGEFIADEWMVIGYAEAYTAEPVDLTGKAVEMRLVQVNNGVPDLDVTSITLSTKDGTIQLTSPSQGGMAFNVRAARTRGLAAGTYDTDILATDDTETTLLLTGQFIIYEGITR